jgi:NitT/TauT family transport system substrate-binding protein
LLSLAATLAGVAALSAGGASAAEKVRIAGLTWPGYGWWHIVNAKGLAPDLDISYQAIEDPFQSFALLSSGQAEIVSSTAEFGPIGASQNMPVRLVAYGNASHGTDKLILRPDITDPTQLKGQKVGVMVGGLPQIMMGIYLENSGVPFDSVEYVNVIMDQGAAAMISGTIAAAQLWEPFASQTLAAMPGAKVVASTADEEWASGGLIADAHFVNAEWVEKKRDTALKAMKAMYDAIAWWKKNPTEGNKIIADGMKMSIADVELVIGKDGTGLDSGLYPYTFIEAAQSCGVASGDPPFGQKNGQLFEHFKLTNTWWVKFKLVKEMYDPSKALDCSLLKDLYDSGYRG